MSISQLPFFTAIQIQTKQINFRIESGWNLSPISETYYPYPKKKNICAEYIRQQKRCKNGKNEVNLFEEKVRKYREQLEIKAQYYINHNDQ